jgi:hypothetical protein
MCVLDICNEIQEKKMHSLATSLKTDTYVVMRCEFLALISVTRVQAKWIKRRNEGIEFVSSEDKLLGHREMQIRKKKERAWKIHFYPLIMYNAP